MKIYIGSRNYKPQGYMTLDIDPSHSPDIIADITDMPQVQSSSYHEVLASHVLEHISWPDSFKALAEFTRILQQGGVLRIAIPDVTALLEQIKSADTDFYAMGLIYGVGGRENDLEVHRYGFTQRMLIDILDVFGYSDYSWWNSPIADASNGWIPLSESHKAGISLNVQARKTKEPSIDPDSLYRALLNNPLQSFRLAVRNHLISDYHLHDTSLFSNAVVYQDIHFRLIEAMQRIKFLEEELRTK
jgi:predicted SAM-dependent methyltransferase